MDRSSTGICTALVLSLALAVPIAQPAVAEEVAPVEPVVSGPATITVTAVGDMQFDGGPDRLIAAKGARAPLSAVGSRLNKADVTVGNLECALSTRGTPVPGKKFTFEGDPRAAQGLKWAGFDLIALGNNHTRDYGDIALRDTLRNLDRAGLAHAGAGVDRAAAWRPAIIERDGARIAYLSFSEIGPSSFAAGARRSGTAFTWDTAAVKRAVRAAHGRADYVIVSFHWGVERSYSPTSRQVRDGRAAIDAGADLVLSHHPHVIQGVEFYKRGLIAYSLGNFVFSPGNDICRDSMILHLSLGPGGVRDVRVEPVYCGTYGKPAPVTGAVARRILGTVRKTSTARGTRVVISGTTARLSRR